MRSRFGARENDSEDFEGRFTRTIITPSEENPKQSFSKPQKGPERRHITRRDLESVALKKVKELYGLSWFGKIKAFFYLTGLSEDLREKDNTGIFL